VHHYRYDRSHRLVSYLCAQDGEALRGGRYCYDLLGRRISKQVVQRNQPKHISWFGWDGDKLVLTERDGTRIHTVYLPHSFVPLLRFEGDKPPAITPLADKLEQEVGITLPPDFKQTLHHMEQALRTNRLSTEQNAWLNQVQLSPDYLENLLDPLPDTPYTAQLYDCNRLGTPQQLINLNGHIDWSITLDAWGNTLSEENPHQLHQPIRMQGQQYDEESGLHYNQHRYYDPTIGRYITQDPIGLFGGINFYRYPLNPNQDIDSLGLVNSNLYPNDTEANKLIHSIADKINISGVFTVGAHGHPKIILDEQGGLLPAKFLAELIRKNKDYKSGMPVRLFSCDTGKGGSGSFASQLAKELQTNVTAPDSKWTVWEKTDEGGLTSTYTAPMDSMDVNSSNTGNWVTYGPSGDVVSSVKGRVEKPGDIH